MPLKPLPLIAALLLAGSAAAELTMPPAAGGVLAAGAADKVLPAGSPPLVVLLDPGAEPRSELAYALARGSSFKLAMGMDMAVAVKVKDRPAPPMPMPRMSMVFEVAATDENPAGEHRIASRLIATSVEPQGDQQEKMAGALRPSLEAMKGVGLGYWIDRKGRVRDVKLDLPPSLPPPARQIMTGMSQSFEAMVTPFPREPIGVGARWQVVSRLATGGADLLQTTEYTLDARSGAAATIAVSLRQLAANDTIRSPEMPKGMFATVKSFDSQGSGTVVLDLASPAPQSGRTSLKTGMTIEVHGGGAASGEVSTVETTTTVTMSRP